MATTLSPSALLPHRISLHPALDPNHLCLYELPATHEMSTSDWPMKTILLEEVTAPPPPPTVRRKGEAATVSWSSGYTSESWASSSSVYSSEEDETDSQYGSANGYGSAGSDGNWSDDEEEWWCSEAGTTDRVLAWQKGQSPDDEDCRGSDRHDAAMGSLGPISPFCEMEIDGPDLNNTHKTKPANEAAAIDSGYAHRCSACDGGFSTIEAFRTHGSQVGASEPCRSAVVYGLEYCEGYIAC